jgi:hypothetical protein
MAVSRLSASGIDGRPRRPATIRQSARADEQVQCRDAAEPVRVLIETSKKPSCRSAPRNPRAAPIRRVPRKLPTMNHEWRRESQGRKSVPPLSHSPETTGESGEPGECREWRIY